MKILTFLACFIPSIAYAGNAHIGLNVVEMVRSTGWQSGYLSHNSIVIIDGE